MRCKNCTLRTDYEIDKIITTFSKKAKNELKKLDKQVSSMILGWVSKNFEGCEDPRIHGKALVANQKGKRRYRVGDNRLVCQIKDEQILVFVLR